MARYKRRRCQCGKVVYQTVWDARLAIRDIPMHRAYQLLKPYRCPETGRWHVGHDHKMYERLARPAKD